MTLDVTFGSGRRLWHIVAILAFVCYVVTAVDYHHQAADQYKLNPGWQEPGLWRPRWIMDRVFDATEEEGEKRDRVYFKLKSDRTMKIFRSEKRPLLEIFKKRKEAEKRKKLFESGDEESSSFKEQLDSTKLDASFYEIDGTWWFQDASPLNGATVKLETREGPDREKVRHDVFCDWGALDGYAAKFRKGRIVKYKLTDAGLPIGTIAAGTFTIRVSGHRPLVGRDFLAFQ